MEIKHITLTNVSLKANWSVRNQNWNCTAVLSIRPAVTYGCETWVLKGTVQNNLMVFERKVLRRIFGRTKERDGTWRIKTNDELDELIRHKNIINYINAQKLSWFGYLQRMAEEREW